MNNTRHELDELKSEIKKLHRKVESAAHTAEPLTEKASEAFEKIREQLKERMDAAREEIGGRVENAVDSVKETGEEVNLYVKENPWKAALIGAGIGILAGWLFTRSKD